jgi:hypothetical protein
MFVNTHFQSPKCILVSCIAYLSPATDLLKLSHWKENDRFSAADIVIFFTFNELDQWQFD